MIISTCGLIITSIIHTVHVKVKNHWKIYIDQPSDKCFSNFSLFHHSLYTDLGSSFVSRSGEVCLGEGRCV